VLPARADRIHLAGGGVVDAESWWVEGDTVQVEGSAGTIGFPRSLVVRIDRDEAPAHHRITRAPSVLLPAAPALASIRATSPVPGAEIQALLDEGTAAILRKDFDGSAARFHEALQKDPSLLRAQVGYALSEIAMGNDGAARPVVLDGVALHPGSADLHELLGDLDDRRERVQEAVAEWRRAFELAPSDRVRDKILRGERELAAGRDYSSSAAAHFTVRHSGAQNPEVAGEVIAYLEARYRDLATMFRHAPSQPITVLLYPETEFRDVTQTGGEVLGVYDGKIRVPLGAATRLDPAGKRVLAHELTHAFVHSKTRGSCPRWLHEGLAQHVEGRPTTRADVAAVLARLPADAPERWEDAGFSYAASLSLTEFLAAERGPDLLVEVLDKLGAGADLDVALRAVYGDDYRGICRRWADALRGGGR
jgi:tetratricopeptide (TPR) repeat protein